MPATNKKIEVTMQGPATYRICVQGRLDPRWADRLGGMNITVARLTERDVETILVGRLEDQAALTDLLNFLYELHLLVVSTQRLESR